MWFKENKTKIIVAIFIIALLVLSFFHGGDVEPVENNDTLDVVDTTTVPTIEPEVEEEPIIEEPVIEEEPIIEEEPVIEEPIIEQEEPIIEEPIIEEEEVLENDDLSCTLTVVCHTILDNLDSLNSEKVDLVPEDGIIYATKTVTFYEGESVFNVLLREMKQNKIHMEYSDTPLYDSAYIEGIANLYEFDTGELSGWMYKVNDWFPNYGCSRYILSDGDVIEFVYTCDLGGDVGSSITVGEQYEG